jgi:hypothetical protein
MNVNQGPIYYQITSWAAAAASARCRIDCRVLGQLLLLEVDGAGALARCPAAVACPWYD